MSTDRKKLYQFLAAQGVSAGRADCAMNSMEGLFRAAESRTVQLARQCAVNKSHLLHVMQAVLHDCTPGETRGFTVRQVTTVPIDQAQCLCSESVGGGRSSGQPTAGLSSFGISTLLYLNCSADIRPEIFRAVHRVVHETLLDDLRQAKLPDGRELGGAWIIPWTVIADVLFFYVAGEVSGSPYVDQLGEIVKCLPSVLPAGFRARDSHAVSENLMVICN